MCLLCPDTALDTLGHHTVTCRRGGDVVTRHNCLRDTFVDLCRSAHLSVQALSKKLDNHAFQSLLSSSSQVNKARILLVSAPRAGSWIAAIPSTGLDLHLDSAECQVELRWWLGLDTSGSSLCPLCPNIALDLLGHHAASCRHVGDVVAQHNHLQDIFANFCHRAHLSVRVEGGYGLARDHINSRPADILVQGWDRGKPAAFDVTVTSHLTPVSLNNASASMGAATYADHPITRPRSTSHDHPTHTPPHDYPPIT